MQTKYQFTTLSHNPEYFEEVVSLIEKEFHYGQQHSFIKDFALLMDPSNFENCWLYVDQSCNQVIAHIAFCPRKMIKDEKILDIAFIGGIATHKDYRKQGLFNSLLGKILEENKNEFALFILWSDIKGLYEKYNFYHGGGLIETGSTVIALNDRPNGFTKTKFNELDTENFEAIKNLYANFNQKYFFTTKRSEKDWSIIKEMDSIDLFVRRDAEENIIQYFCINKGRDLTGVIHECSTTPELYLQLVNDLKRYRLWLPESDAHLIKNAQLFYSSYMKIGAIDKLEIFLKELDPNIQSLTKNDKIELTHNNQTYLLEELDFIQAIFGPTIADEFKHLKLSPYIPGTDSV